MNVSPPTELQPRTSRLAVASLALGLLALLLPAALLAWAFGLRAIRAIHASDGQLSGLRLATAGLVLGIAGTVVTVVGFAILILLRLNANRDRVMCQNNLRQIGVAVNAYCDQNNHLFPSGTVISPKLPPERRMSWYVSVLPFVEHKPPTARLWLPLVQQVFDPEVPWDAPPNASAAQALLIPFLCPSLHQEGPRDPAGITTYVGLAGVDPDAALLPKTSPRAGFFGYDRVISRDDVHAGISFTTMVAETTHDLGPWVAGGPPTDRGLGPDETSFLGAGRPFGGLHPGGANVLWVDGSVRFIPGNTPANQFRQWSTLADRGE